MPAPKGNLNGLKNGARLNRLTVGELPKELLSAKVEGRKYRRALESEFERVWGEVTPTAAHSIDTATGSMVHAAICRWLLRSRVNSMSTADVLKCSAEILRSKETRDRAVAKLRLDVDSKDFIIESLYTPQDAPTCVPTGKEVSEATETPEAPREQSDAS